MKLDLDKIEAAAEASRRTFHAPLISPDELAALVRIARAAVGCQRSWNPRALRTNSELDMADALREAGL